MNGSRKSLLLVAVAILVAGASAGATDQPAPGTRLILRVRSSGREKLSFRSSGSFTIPTPGSPDDPMQAGASLQLLNPNTSESFTFDLPSSHWSVSTAGTYKYRDKGPVESGKVKVAIISGRTLKVSGQKVGITLDESSQGELDVVLSSGSFRYCAAFADGAVRTDSPGVFSAKGAPPPSACPSPPATTTSTITITLPPTTIPDVTTTTVTTPLTTTTATIPLPPLGMVAFTITPGSSTCGGPFVPPPAAPLSGEVYNKSGQKIADLGVDCLYAGAGTSGQPPSMIPDGSTSVLAVTGISSGVALTLSGSAGSGPADCTLGAGPAMRCLNGNLGTDGMGACSSDADCGDQKDACAPQPNCFFGPPIPVPAPATPALSTCIVNAIATDASGAANLLTRETTLNASLAPGIYLTGDGESPCPQCCPSTGMIGSSSCTSGTCTAGDRQGMPCSGGVGSKNTTVECPPESIRFVGRLAVNLSPLTTGTTTLTADPAGMFCPDQAHSGAFGIGTPRTIRETGVPLGGLASPFATTVAGVFCIPATGSPAVNVLADLPGPAAVSVSGMTSIQLF